MTYSNQTASQRGAYKRSIVFGVFLAAIVAMLPGQVLAQEPPTGNCPAGLSVGVNAPEDKIFELNEPVPIEITFSMGFSPIENKVNISHFAYLLDCEEGDNFEECESADPTPGNTVVFDESSIATDCTFDGATSVELVTTPSGAIKIDFDVEDNANNPSSIVLQRTVTPLETNECTVTFDVSVAALSGLNATKEIIEFAGTSGADAQCTDPAGNFLGNGAATNNVGFRLANPNAVFWVTKDFTDDNKSEVDVHLRCNTGTILNPDFSITDPAANGTFPTVGFIVYGIPSIGANCRVFEDPIPSGYSQSYEASARAALQGVDYDELGELDDDAGCFYDGVSGGEYDCDITNTGEPAMFTVNKEWVVINTGGDFVDEKAVVTISCNNEILPNVPKPGDGIVMGTLLDPNTKTGSLGDGESLVALVDTTTGDAVCFAVEKINQSGVESVDDCQKARMIAPGGKSECTFVNTVFFEGIPTLNQYGMALMALLMLGLGVIGFRRFG